MNKTLLLFTALAALAALGLPLLSAQEIRPKEPMLPRMPERSSWTILFGRAAPEEAGRNEPGKQALTNRLTVSKDGTTYRVVSEKPVGGVREAWVVGSVVFLLSSDGLRCAIADSSAFPGTDFSRSDFEAFEWVSAKNFIGSSERENRRVFVFETDSLKRVLSARERGLVVDAQMALQGEEPSTPVVVSDEAVLQVLGWAGTVKALLDQSTQRPVLLESGAYRVQVEILAGSPALSLPAPIRERLDLIAREASALQKRPTRPAR